MRLKGSIFLNAQFREPWGMDVPQGQLGILHVITRGSCWLTIPGTHKPISLNQGDVLLLPRGLAHSLGNNRTGQTIPADQILAMGSGLHNGPLRFGGKGKITDFLCGAFEYDRSLIHPLIISLPEFIHIHAPESDEFAWLLDAKHLLNNETQKNLLGSSAIIDRLSEVIFSQVLRVFIQQSSFGKGFLHALRDETIVEALNLIHSKPERKWTLASLARSCGISRSALASRFKIRLGDTPMNYLTSWRIHKAQELLSQSQLSIAQIAEQVGYQSESAFSNAFKKILKKGPGLFRREKQDE